MVTEGMNDKLTDSYAELLMHLSASSKLELIAKLAQSIKPNIGNGNLAFFQAFGAWDENDNAETLTEGLRASRTFNRNLESL